MARHSTLGGCLATAAIAALSLSLPVLATPKTAQLSAKVVAPSNDQLKPASPNAVSNHVLSLERVSRPKGSSSLLRGLAKQHGSTHINDLFDSEFIATIEWNGTPVKVIVDSGSSDTWLVHEGFQCVDVNGTSLPVRLPLHLCLVAARSLPSFYACYFSFNFTFYKNANSLTCYSFFLSYRRPIVHSVRHLKATSSTALFPTSTSTSPTATASLCLAISVLRM